MPRKLVFFGVSTHASSIMDVFPLWSAVLGLDASIVGWDIPLGAPAETYRAAVESLRDDDAVAGALITSHKVAFHEHTADLFDELDADAIACEEISCIVRRPSGLRGAAKDPGVAARVLGGLLPADHWRSSGAEVACLGSGGAGTAITVALLRSATPPRKVIVSDTRPAQLQRLRDVHRRIGASVPVEYHAIESTAQTDGLVTALPPGSLVVNATGMGKDIPGSPLSDTATLPREGLAWELNYRGDLVFLRQAERQRATRGIRAEHGWEYFVQSWVAVIEDVFDCPMTAATVARLAEAADQFRPIRPTPTGAPS